MSTNKELSKLFDRMAKILEILQANRFKVIAIQKAARVLDDTSFDVAQKADDIKKLTEIDGIGKGIAEKIIEYVESGEIKELQELEAEVPHGVLQMLNISGLGPKTIAMFWKKAGIESLDELKEKLESQEGTAELEALPRMGKKSLDKIRKSIAFAETASDRIKLGDAWNIAQSFIEELKDIPNVDKIEYAGSLRRGQETIGDIDLLIAAKSKHHADIHKAFTQLPEVSDIVGSGETKSSIRTKDGIQVDLRTLPPEQYGAALMYFTGSKEHNVAMRERAIKQKMRLNEYGLWKESDEATNAEARAKAKPVAAKTEKDIYKALKLSYIPPELRQDKNEISLAEKDEIPTLVELDDIKAELHAHTTASDGSMSIEELAQQAIDRGYHTIAVTDHSRSQQIANGLSNERLEKHIKNIHKANDKIKDITILAGSEVDILADGTLDYPDELLAQLDLVVASPHAALSQEPNKATDRFIRAMENPYVHFIGHLTGRLISRREGLSPDISKLLKVAKETKTTFEINANHWRLDLCDTHARAAIQSGLKLAINTDAHNPIDFTQLRYGVLTARRAGATKNDIINCMTPAKFKNWLNAKRKHHGVSS